MQALTERQRDVLDFIKDFCSENGIPPTRQEIAEAQGFRSKTAAADHLKALQKKGYIHLFSDTSRGIQVLDSDEIPIIGSVAAGCPIEAVENVEQLIPIPPGLFQARPTYLLRVKGESMIDAGILDGDLIAVQKRSTAQSGQIVIARINDEVTVKTLKLNKKGPALMPANPAFEPIYLAPEELIIEGVFVGLIRNPPRI
ncbi:MAG: LexA repressor [Moraxellaceae bacterium]|nr:MAG: LexA repressor [Moraxellaceae bacterium]